MKIARFVNGTQIRSTSGYSLDPKVYEKTLKNVIGRVSMTSNTSREANIKTDAKNSNVNAAYTDKIV